ncbi:MAG: alpha/beta hydrolase [Tenericutes bacterium]|nr:alpha/beta hydrolase [Mycoplasmatota bacterium]
MVINNVEVYYERYNQGGEKPLVFLHGWGQNTEMMLPVAKPFIENHEVILIDLPGFGKSGQLDRPYEVSDYVELLHKLLQKLDIKKPTLIGHSYGGKISLLYASKYEVEKLVLFGSPFQKEIEKESLKLKTLRTLKKIPGINKLEGFAKKHIGSTDYKNASPVMRETLVKTVNLDITEEVKKIKAPTLLIWGTADEAVSIDRAYELEKLIPDAGLVVYENATHYAYLENLGQTISVMKSFLN